MNIGCSEKCFCVCVRVRVRACVCACVFEKLFGALWEIRETNGYCQLAILSWLEAEAQVRKLGEQLKSEKNLQLSPTLLASGLTDKAGEQNNTLETLACHLAEWGGHKASWINVWVLSEYLWQRASLVKSACQYRRHRFNSWVRKTPWREEWQPTPVFLSGKSHGQWSVVGYNPWGLKRVKHDLAIKQ